jgi:hypothetical protein
VIVQWSVAGTNHRFNRSTAFVSEHQHESDVEMLDGVLERR